MVRLGVIASVLIRDGEIKKETGVRPCNVDVAKLARQRIASACKRRYLAKIIRIVLSKDLPLTFTKRNSAYVRRNMYNARQKTHPFTKPKTVDEVHSTLAQMTIETCPMVLRTATTNMSSCCTRSYPP